MQSLAYRLASLPADVAYVLRALFMPKRYGDNFRLASQGAGLPSAAANMSVTYNSADWDQVTAASVLPAADFLVFLFANPLRAFIQYMPNPSGQTYSYTLQSENITAGSAFQLVRYEEIRLFPRFATPTTAFQPHGQILFPGYDEGCRNYMYVQQGDGGANSMVVTLSTPATLLDNWVRFYIWDGKHPRLIQSTNMAAGDTSVSLLAPGAGGVYVFASVYWCEPSAGVTASVTITGNGAVYAHRPVSNIGTLIQQAYGIRVNSCSIRVQNDASPLNRNGNTTAVTVSKSIPWTNFATSAAALTQLQNYREFTADKGYYGIPLPDSDEDVSEYYDDICETAFRALTAPITSYPLSERRPYKAVSFNIPVASGRSLTFDVTHTVEFLTNNKLQEQALSNISEDSVCDAIVVASTQETDYENTPNWRDALETVDAYMDKGSG